MDNACSSVIDKTDVLQPAVIPNPCQSDGEDESWSDKGKEDVSIDVGSFSDRAGCDGSHHDAKRQVVNKSGVVLIGVIHADEVVLSKHTAWCLDTEAKSDNEKREGRHGNDEYSLQENDTVLFHLDGAGFLHHEADLREDNHDHTDDHPHRI